MSFWFKKTNKNDETGKFMKLYPISPKPLRHVHYENPENKRKTQKAIANYLHQN